jgi:hypothetical protein
VVHLLGGDFLAVHLERAGPAAANAAHAIEGQRFSAKAVILEVKLDDVSSGRQSIRTFPANTFQIKGTVLPFSRRS